MALFSRFKMLIFPLLLLGTHKIDSFDFHNIFPPEINDFAKKYGNILLAKGALMSLLGIYGGCRLFKKKPGAHLRPKKVYLQKQELKRNCGKIQVENGKIIWKIPTDSYVKQARKYIRNRYFRRKAFGLLTVFYCTAKTI